MTGTPSSTDDADDYKLQNAIGGFKLLVFRSLYVMALLSACSAFVLTDAGYKLFDAYIVKRLRTILRGAACRETEVIDDEGNVETIYKAVSSIDVLKNVVWSQVELS